MPFFLDDYQFERVWNRPRDYLKELKKYAAVLSPDFSLYLDMPMPAQLWNVFRSRVIAAFWQKNGIKVIPTIQWADERSFDYCFQCIEEGGTIAMSTVGVMRSNIGKEIFKKGAAEAVKRIKPKRVIIYGKEMNLDLGVETIYFDQRTTRR